MGTGMKVIIILLITKLFVLVSCSSSKQSDTENSLVSLLAKEDLSQGICTVRGIGSSIRAGFTQAKVEEQSIYFLSTGNTHYAVVGIQDANPGTELNLNFPIQFDLYKSSECPLDLDRVELAQSKKDYIHVKTTDTKITFLKKGSYMGYIQIPKNSFPSATPTMYLSGTPTGGSQQQVPGVGSLTFTKACNNTNLNLCTELFGSESNCDSGESELPNQDRCSTANVLGVCRRPIGETGYRFTIFYNQGGNSHEQATILCQAAGGFYFQGYSDP